MFLSLFFRLYIVLFSIGLFCNLPAFAEETKGKEDAKVATEELLSDVGKRKGQPIAKSAVKNASALDEANPDFLDLSLTDNDSEALLDLRDAIGEALTSNLEIKIESIAPGIASERIIQALADFDPVFEARARYENLRTPQTTQEFVSTGGTPIIDNAARARGGGSNLPGRVSRLFNEENVSSDVLLTGRLITGTEYELGVKSNRYSNDLTRDPLITSIDPEFRAFAGLSFTQPLLQGFGIKVNKTPILISQSDRKIASLEFKAIASKIVKEVIGAYYDLYLSYEDVKVKEFEVGVAQLQIAEKRELIERGTATEQDVSNAKTLLLQSFERFLLARQTMLTKNADLLLRIQTDFDPLRHPLYLPQSAPEMNAPPLDRVRITEDALNFRPEYLTAVETVKKLDIELTYRRNQKMPKLDLEATIGTLGLNDGVTEAFSEAFDNQGHEYGVGLVFSYPLGNRKSKALYHEAQKVSNQAVLRVKWEEVQANILIDQKLDAVDTHLKRIEAAQHTREAEQLNLEKARDNLEKGTSTETLVRVIEHAVLEARLREVAAAGDLQKALVDLWDVNGTLLQRFGILIDSEIDREPTLRFGENGELLTTRSKPGVDERNIAFNQAVSSATRDEEVPVGDIVEDDKPKTLMEYFKKMKGSSGEEKEVPLASGAAMPEEVVAGENASQPEEKESRGFFGIKFYDQRKKNEGEFVPYDEAKEAGETSQLGASKPGERLTGGSADELPGNEVEKSDTVASKEKKFLFWRK